MNEIEKIENAFDNISFSDFIYKKFNEIDIKIIINAIKQENLDLDIIGGFSDLLKKIDIVQNILKIDIFPIKFDLKIVLQSELNYRKAIIYLLSPDNKDINKAEKILLELWENKRDPFKWQCDNPKLKSELLELKYRAGYYLSMYIYLEEYCVEKEYYPEDEYFFEDYEIEKEEIEKEQIYKITKENIVKAEIIYNSFSSDPQLPYFVKSFMLEFQNKLEEVTEANTEFKILIQSKRELSVKKIEDTIKYKDKVDLYIDYLSDNKAIFVRGNIKEITNPNIRILALVLKGTKRKTLLDLFDLLEDTFVTKISNLGKKYLKEPLLLNEFRILNLVVKNDKNMTLFNQKLFNDYTKKFKILSDVVSNFYLSNLENEKHYKEIYIENLKKIVDKNLFSLLIENLTEIDKIKNKIVNNFDFNNLKKLNKSEFNLLFKSIEKLNREIESKNEDFNSIFFYILNYEEIRKFNLFLELTFENFIDFDNLSPFLERKSLSYLFPIKDFLSDKQFESEFNISKIDFLNILNNIVNLIEDPIEYDKNNDKYKINNYISTAVSYKEKDLTIIET